MDNVAIVAIVVAAGRGLRAAGRGDAVPKQYRPIGGVPVLSRALAAFASHSRVDAVLAVIAPGDLERYRAAVAPLGDALLPPAEGGARRQQSVRAGLERLAAHPPRAVLLHDAARPFVTAGVIDRVLDALDGHDGAAPGLQVAETLKRAEESRIVQTVDRAGLWAAQTPQGFRFDKILAAHRAAAEAGRGAFTDDASVAEWYGLDVAMVEGEAGNAKLTTARDFELAERLLRGDAGAGDWRTGLGFDVHAFVPGDHVMLCGIRVPHERALAGHSDADVGLHALTDALLGAVGDGDIGVHFPPADARWRGAESHIFLRDAADRVRARGGAIANVDVTLICQAPKIGAHRDAMRARIAEILDIEPARVSVKATTTEGLGFAGRGEGIAAQAVATVRLG